MKFKSLKFFVVVSFAILSTVMVSCGDDTGNNSTTTANNTDSSGIAKDSSSVPSATPSDTTGGKMAGTTTAKKKKVGHASVKMNAEANAKVEKDNMGNYSSAEVAPEYNGGHSALESYINKNVEYPSDAIDNEIQGTVSVRFLVDENGKVTNVSTTGNKIGYGLEEEAVRVVSKMPQWTPGKVKGKTVKTWRTLPITFKLDES